MKFAIFGAGRIGKIHAQNVMDNPNCELLYIVDVFEQSAKDLALKTGAKIATTEQVFADPAVDAVIIASSTDTHADLIEAAAKAKKAIFCEKPVDLSSERVKKCIETAQKENALLFVAFNRRFDPNFQYLKQIIDNGQLGHVEQVVITSRDPNPPPASYVNVSGGLFRDMMIHDLDMAVWLLGEKPIEVMTYASCLVDPAIGEAGDVDTAMVLLKTASGKIAHINNSRRATYGYDQRIDVHGQKGSVQAQNVPETTVIFSNEQGIHSGKPEPFFLERYAKAYKNELNYFVDAIHNGKAVTPSGIDGQIALLLADAATESHKTGQPVTVTL